MYDLDLSATMKGTLPKRFVGKYHNNDLNIVTLNLMNKRKSASKTRK